MVTARTNHPAGDKTAWRRRLLAARRALSPEAREARDAALQAAAVALVRALPNASSPSRPNPPVGPSDPASRAPRTRESGDPDPRVVTPLPPGEVATPGDAAAPRPGPVCAYLPIGTEPGGPGLPDVLAAAGVPLWLPVVPAGPGPLDWARHDGRTVPGPLGLREPAGPRLGASAITRAALVLVPALAVDRRGVRLGRGGGFYDRTLALATRPVVALLGEGELVDELPAEPHDRPVSAVLLPGAGLVTLGKMW